ncbi:MAG TPA: NADH-quinone oxidoreductase subunit NuoH [Planctomycetaceae bacterium]|nr:NADH-quinone oxidoreductase subunit NuoH [Planctomycetaceae bacterium]
MEWLQNPLVMAGVAIAVALGGILTTCAYLILLERKLSAWMQDRLGPNRVGPAGLLQPLADGAKLILKEDVIPGHVNKFLFILGPALSVFTTMLAFAVVPFGPVSHEPGQFPFVIAPGIDLGIVFIFAVTSLSVYSIILGGWASNNKYSALGSLRASAQVVSYEIPLGMSVVGIALLHSSMSLEKILLQQAEMGFLGWNIWYQPVACLIFFTAALAESNRLPFDLTECEQELVGGFHTEYSAMKWAMFFLGEYTHVITISFLTSVLFLGGWHFPFIAEANSAYAGAWAVKVAVLLFKVSCMIVLIQMLRWTIPRFRFDQLMSLAWKGLIPMATANVLIVMCVLEFQLPRLWLLPLSLLLFVAVGLIGTQASLPAGATTVRRKKTAVPAVAAAHH